jgi:hypothetical protein
MFRTPIEISSANSGKVYAYGSGTQRVAPSADGLECEAGLRDVHYAPGVHARLMSLKEPQQQRWSVPCTMSGAAELGWKRVC